MNVREHDDSLNISKVWKTINVKNCWRTNRFAAYRRGFEKEDLPIGDKLVLIEDGVARTLEVPDVPVSIIRPDGRSEIIGLRAAIGMLDFDLAKLEYDPEFRIVSVASDFNPETDVRVVDIMGPPRWALVDANGYPLKSKPSAENNSDARYSYVRRADEFEDESTGYHGSVARYVYYDYRRYVGLYYSWSIDSVVTVVEREPPPRIRFEEPHSQSPYRDAPGIMEGSGSRVSGPDAQDTGHNTQDTEKPGMLKRLSLALGF